MCRDKEETALAGGPWLASVGVMVRVMFRFRVSNDIGNWVALIVSCETASEARGCRILAHK